MISIRSGFVLSGDQYSRQFVEIRLSAFSVPIWCWSNHAISAISAVMTR
jgi:hypothetical protein